MTRVKLFMSYLLVAMPFIVHGAIYKWVDDEGNTHYTATPPPDAQQTEKMKVNAYKPQDSSTYKKPSLKGDEETAEGEENAEENSAAQKPDEEKKKPLTREQKAQRNKACETARSNLATIRAKGQIRVRDEDGNIRYISDKEKQAKIQKTQELIRKYCK